MNGELRAQIRRIAGAMAPRPMDCPPPQTRLIEDLGYDSLRLIELALAIEQQFDLEPLSNAETLSVKTIAEMEKLVLRLRGDGAA